MIGIIHKEARNGVGLGYIYEAIELGIPLLKREVKSLIKYQKDLKELEEPICGTFGPFILEIKKPSN